MLFHNHRPMMAASKDNCPEMPVVPGKHFCFSGSCHGHHGQVWKVCTAVNVPPSKFDYQR